MKTRKEKLGYLLLLVLSVIALVGMMVKEPIAQDIDYHNFKDKKTILTIPNFWNVVSNVPFMIVGLLGLNKLRVSNKLKIVNESKISYVFFFTGALLVALGSSYYHLHPTNYTLLWDRLPMTIAFMALFSIIVCEFISVQKGKTLLMPLILIGILSVMYWTYTEYLRVGDLRFYLLVQFYPMFAIPIIFICFNSRFTKTQAYWWLLLAYVIAKLCEHFDEEIYSALGGISGHSLKHLAAAMGLYVVLHSYEKRFYINNNN